MRSLVLALALVLPACTFNVQRVSAPAVDTVTTLSFTTLRADLRSLGADPTAVTVRGDRASGAASTVTLSGIASSGTPASALSDGVRASFVAVDAATVSYTPSYAGPSSDTVFVSSIALHVPATTALESEASDASYDVEGLSGSVQLTTDGAIHVAGAGSAVLRTSFGAVDVSADAATVDALGGHVRLDAGSVVVRAGQGLVEGVVRGAGGSVETAGGPIHLTLAATLTGDLALTTTGGEVIVTIDPSAGLVLDLRSEGGSVDVQTPGVTHQGSPFVATLGAGGPRLTVRTSGGAIHVVTP